MWVLARVSRVSRLKLMLPKLRVTLAESQGKKASFLREAARVLELDLRPRVWPGQRVEVVAAQAGL